MLYQIKDGTVSAGGQTILSHIDFYIKEKEKIAVVGKNGAGKTTLLRLLAGELTPDRDDSRGSYGRSNDMVTGAARIKIPFQNRGLTTRWSTTGFLQALALKRVTRRGFLGAFQEENRRRFL